MKVVSLQSNSIKLQLAATMPFMLQIPAAQDSQTEKHQISGYVYYNPIPYIKGYK